jgi:3-carboxy-cis,cis-muconate cycloisomerase
MASVLEGGLVTPEITDVFSSYQWVRAMLRFEAELTRAQAAAGLVPQAAAMSILGTCKIELFDTEKLGRERSRSDGLVTPLVKNLKEMVGIFNPEAVQFVHLGASSQDAHETVMALATSDVLHLIRADLVVCVQSLMALAQKHLDTPMLVRALVQPEAVTSVGFKSVSWAAPLVRSLARLDIAGKQALQLHLRGATEALSPMHGCCESVMQAMAAALNLGAAETPWQPQRDTWVALGCELAVVVGSIGKIAHDLLQMSRFEIGEVQGLDALDCSAAVTAAQCAPQRIATLLAALSQPSDRAPGAWQVEQEQWTQLVMSAYGSARSMAQVLTTISVDPHRMQLHIDAVARQVGLESSENWLGAAQVKHAASLAAHQLTLWAREF